LSKALLILQRLNYRIERYKWTQVISILGSFENLSYSAFRTCGVQNDLDFQLVEGHSFDPKVFNTWGHETEHYTAFSARQHIHIAALYYRVFHKKHPFHVFIISHSNVDQ